MAHIMFASFTLATGDKYSAEGTGHFRGGEYDQYKCFSPESVVTKFSNRQVF